MPSAESKTYPLSITSQQIRVCICGQPVRPNIGGVRGGRVGNEAQNNFMESLHGAVKSRAEVPQMIEALVNENITRSEFVSSSGGS